MTAQTFKLRYGTVFNGTVQGSGIVEVARSGLTYTVSMDFSGLSAESSSFSPASYNLLMQAVSDGAFYKISASNLLSQSQPIDPTLTALAGLDATPGLVEQSGADTFTKRAIGVATAESVLLRGDGDVRYHPIFTTLSVSAGGTGISSYTTGDLVYASGATTLAKLPSAATGNVLKAGGAGAAPFYDKVSLTADVSGTLPVANGGTGQTSYTNGQLLIGNTTGNTLAKATLTAGGGVTITNGAGSITVATTPGQLPGTTTNDAATASNIGEYVSSAIPSGSALAFTTATPRDITSISLTAGDWNVWINARFTGGATSTVRAISASISTTSATLDSTVGRFAAGFYNGQAPFADTNLDVGVGPVRISLSSTTTIYFVAQAVFSVSTCSGFGIIHARRVR